MILLSISYKQSTIAYFQINDTNYKVSENDIVIVPPNSLHFATQEAGKPFDFIAIVFSLDFISQTHDEVIYQKYITPFLNHYISFPACIFKTSNDGMHENNIYNILYKIKLLYQKKTLYYELDIKTCIYQLWHELLTYAKDSSEVTEKSVMKSSVKTNQIKEILSYLKTHYNDTLSLHDIAEYFHLSEGHLCRMFKDVTGKTLTDYLNYYRITMSTSLLLKTDMSITQIAISVGFNNVSYFNKMFKKYMNKTPGEFRRTKRSNL